MEQGQLRVEVGALIDRVGRVARSLQFVEGMSPAQWEALRFIARANRYSRNPSALADFLGATKGTVSQTLIALEGKGYLRRARGTPDRRAVDLTLTTDGEALLDHDPLRSLDEAATALAPATKAALVDGLGRLLRDLLQRHGGSEFGVCEGCCLLCADAAISEPGGPHRCGLTGEPLDNDDKRLICVNFRADA